MYVLWNIFDYLLRDHKRSDLFITIKILVWMAYSITSSWFIGELITGVAQYHEDLKNESTADAPDRPVSGDEDFIFWILAV